MKELSIPMMGIAFAGKMGSGKTTCAKFAYDYICYQKEYHHRGLLFFLFLGEPQLLRFACPIKEALAILLGRDVDKSIDSDRRALQEIPTLVKSIYGDHHFTDLMEQKLKTIYENISGSWPNWYGISPFTIIDDVRFPHEVDLLQKFHIPTVLIEASEEIRASRVPLHNTAHESECALDGYPFKHVLSNTGNLEDLEKAVKTLLEELLREEPC